MLRALVVALVAARGRGCTQEPPGCARGSWKSCPVTWVGLCDYSRSGITCTAQCRGGYVPVVPPANGSYYCLGGTDGWSLLDKRGQLVCERAPEPEPEPEGGFASGWFVVALLWRI